MGGGGLGRVVLAISRWLCATNEVTSCKEALVLGLAFLHRESYRTVAPRRGSSCSLVDSVLSGVSNDPAANQLPFGIARQEAGQRLKLSTKAQEEAALKKPSETRDVPMSYGGRLVPPQVSADAAIKAV